ncbi:OmpA family protein [Porphyromonas sp.]|uniref:OmpA family protein n=1 Tax=Porphyromonas sp. TaxID=1924944 RepID=UPI0026DA9C5F|nr:OmpA family protein [Porphyromonas sp.]MDO4771396.1 OmpA family protein [Porphyromonas sp.]
MKRTIFALAATLAFSSVAFAQTSDEIKREADKIRQEIKKDYSNWTIGVYGGLPFFQGADMATLGHDKTRFGYMAGLQLGYQFNPFFGISLTGQYGKGDAGYKKGEDVFRVKPNGMVTLDPAGSMQFSELYASIPHMSAGLHFDFNIAPLFSSSANRKFAVVLSPAAYLQKFMPELKKISDDKVYSDPKIGQDLTLGLGGDLDIRFRASKHLDLLLKGGAAWIANNASHDGINHEEYTKLRHAVVGQIGLGLIYKIGNSDKVDNIIYAPTCRTINKMAAERVAARLEAERIAKEKAEAERLAREKAEAERIAREKAEAERRRLEEEAARKAAEKVEVNLPSIHFVRGSAVVNKKKYAKELAEMVTFLNANPTLSVDVIGFCDHTGTEALNDKLSIKRAENVKKYLVSKGIDAARLSVKGMGKDDGLSGKAALSVKARRVEVK